MLPLLLNLMVLMIKNPSQRILMNTGDHWLRSGLQEIDEMKFGSSSTSAAAMAVDLEYGVHPGIVGCENYGKEIVKEKVDSNKEAHSLVIGCKLTYVNGNEEEIIASNSVLVKKTDVEYKSDAKLIRSEDGPPINLGSENHATTEIMETGENSKNGPEVVPVF